MVSSAAARRRRALAWPGARRSASVASSAAAAGAPSCRWHSDRLDSAVAAGSAASPLSATLRVYPAQQQRRTRQHTTRRGGPRFRRRAMRAQPRSAARAGGAHAMASSSRPSRKAALPRALASSASAAAMETATGPGTQAVSAARRVRCSCACAARTGGLVGKHGARLRQRITHLHVAAPRPARQCRARGSNGWRVHAQGLHGCASLQRRHRLGGAAQRQQRSARAVVALTVAESRRHNGARARSLALCRSATRLGPRGIQLHAAPRVRQRLLPLRTRRTASAHGAENGDGACGAATRAAAHLLERSQRRRAVAPQRSLARRRLDGRAVPYRSLRAGGEQASVGAPRSERSWAAVAAAAPRHTACARSSRCRAPSAPARQPCGATRA